MRPDTRNIKSTRFCLALLLAVALPASLPAATNFVDRTASGSNNGTSWANAFTNLQTALFFANNGDQIWVAQGTYYPDEGPFQSNNDTNATFLINEDIEVYGGFDNLDTELSDRDVFSNTTILSGDLAQDDVDTSGNGIPNSVSGINGGNAVAVVTIGSGALDATLDSFYIAGCVGANGSGIRSFTTGSITFDACQIRVNRSSNGGAGMHITEGNAVLRGCRFQQNETSGGATVYATNANLMIDDTRIIGSTAISGVGGLLVSAAGKDVVISNSQFHSNVTIGDGGGVYVDGGNVRVVNTSFRGNDANSGGGINLQNATSVFVNCVFAGNKSLINGAAIRNINSTSTVINCTFSGNAANSFAAFFGAGSEFINTIVWDNSSVFSPGQPDLSASANLFTSCLIQYTNLSGINNNLNGAGGGVSPLFLSPSVNSAPATDGDYSLQPMSPCVEAGDDGLYNGPDKDIEGGLRFVDYVFDEGFDATIDMGAYEFSFNVYLDNDNDNLPDIWELANTQPPGTSLHSGTNDVDMDGRNGIMEFAGGTDPNSSNPPPALTLFLGPLDTPVLNHSRSKFATNYLDLVLQETTNIIDSASWTSGTVSQSTVSIGIDTEVIISTVVNPALNRPLHAYRLNAVLK